MISVIDADKVSAKLGYGSPPRLIGDASSEAVVHGGAVSEDRQPRTCGGKNGVLPLTLLISMAAPAGLLTWKGYMGMLNYTGAASIKGQPEI